MMYEDVLSDFVFRTKRNLELIERSSITRQDNAYEVTQVVNSMLGLIVMPREQMIRGNLVLPRLSLRDLAAEDWPLEAIRVWKGRRVDWTRANFEGTLWELWRRLRNGVSHFNLSFQSMGGDISGLKIQDFSLTEDANHRLVQGDLAFEMKLDLNQLRLMIDKLTDVLEAATRLKESPNG